MSADSGLEVTHSQIALALTNYMVGLGGWPRQVQHKLIITKLSNFGGIKTLKNVNWVDLSFGRTLSNHKHQETRSNEAVVVIGQGQIRWCFAILDLCNIH